MGSSSKQRNGFVKLISIFILAFSLLLTGCVDVTPEMPALHFATIPHAKRQAHLRALMFYGVDGAFSVRYAGATQHTVAIANYVWQQLGMKNYRISISSALNVYNFILLRRIGVVTLWRNGKRFATGPDAESLMLKVLGWNLPISNLVYWMRSTPAPGPHKAQFDEYGHLVTLEQNGWFIRYGSFRHFRAYDLPGIVVLNRPGYAIKIIIKHWTLFRKSPEIVDQDGD